MHNLNLTTINPLAQLSPRVSAQYHINSDWAVPGNLGRYSQLPQPSQYWQMPPTIGRDTTMQVLWTKRQQVSNFRTVRRAVSLSKVLQILQQYAVSVGHQMSFSQAIGAYVAVGDQVSSQWPRVVYGLELFLQQKLKGTYWWTVSYNFGFSDARLNSGQDWTPTVWSQTQHQSRIG